MDTEGNELLSSSLARALIERLPASSRDFALDAALRLKHRTVFRQDRRRFVQHYARMSGSPQIGSLEARMIFHSHSLEKGLSHDNIRLGFGRRALDGLCSAMREYTDHGFDTNSLAYVNSLSALRAYLELHRENGFDVGDLMSSFPEDVIRSALESDSTMAGTQTLAAESKKQTRVKGFLDVFQGRSSVRHFSDDPVDLNRVKRAIEVAMKAPSVCNRQATRIRVISTPETIRKVLEVQGGFKGYAYPPMLLAVSSNTERFLTLTERNQPYVDGGIFSMALLLSLEYEELAACPLNAMFDARRDKRVRSILDLSDAEVIIMFIAVGNFRHQYKVAKSFRYPAEEITRFL